MDMIYLASDHGGFLLKEKIKEQLIKIGLLYEDCGNSVLDENDDFVDFSKDAAQKIQGDDRGIFLCRNGVGVSIVANRFSHIRAVLGFDTTQVSKARNDDNCNVLCLPADYLNLQQVLPLVDVFLNTQFSGEERFVRRIDKIKSINQ